MNEVRRVSIQTIQHKHQRYDTIGDWLYSAPHNAQVTIFTSADLGDWRMSMSCAVHELVEALLCVNDGVSEDDISAFDIAYEEARSQGKSAPCGCTPTKESEPGEDKHAPYRTQHAFADGIERLLANALGVVWDEYSERVVNLEYKPEAPHGAT